MAKRKTSSDSPDNRRSIRIRDSYLIETIEKIHKARGGHGTLSKTACNLILERAMQIEIATGETPANVPTY